MKTITIIILAALAGAASAQDIVLETIEGATYERVRVTAMNKTHVKFMHAAGVVVLPLSTLTADARKAINAPEPDEFADIARPAAPQTVPTGQPAAAAQNICTRCRGAKTIRCPSCSGSGFGPDTVTHTPCAKCAGKGHTLRREVIASRETGGGKRKQYDYGWVNIPCKTCGGSGKIQGTKRTYCATCGGHKVVPCPQCSGRR